jgi:hypothetical protein
LVGKVPRLPVVDFLPEKFLKHGLKWEGYLRPIGEGLQSLAADVPRPFSRSLVCALIFMVGAEVAGLSMLRKKPQLHNLSLPIFSRQVFCCGLNVMDYPSEI